MPEDVIKKECHHCGKAFNWEWIGCYIDGKFFCDNNCAKEVYPDDQPTKQAPHSVLFNGRKD